MREPPQDEVGREELFESIMENTSELNQMMEDLFESHKMALEIIIDDFDRNMGRSRIGYERTGLRLAKVQTCTASPSPTPRFESKPRRTAQTEKHALSFKVLPQLQFSKRA